MADEKAKAKEKKYKLKNPLELLLYGILIGAIINGIVTRLSGKGAVSNPLVGWFDSIWPYVLAILKFLSTVLVLFFATGIVYATIRLTQLRTDEKKKMKEAEAAASPVTEKGEPRNIKWERVAKHINSDNPNDWRLAILEADIILGELLDIMGYHGDTLGDQLKSVERSDFTTIDNAWEAHKTRNQIAHEGSDFLITQREAKRIVSLYKTVFEEFRYI